jgi:hypothetical protein
LTKLTALEASSGQTKEYDALYDFLNDTSSPLQSGMKIVLMTATPGDTVEDVVKLMNILGNQVHQIEME